MDRTGQRGVERSVLSIISRDDDHHRSAAAGSEVAGSERSKGLMGFRIKQNDQRGQMQVKHRVGRQGGVKGEILVKEAESVVSSRGRSATIGKELVERIRV